MIDRGITEVHANETIESMGIFLQMFPYPCYIYDRFVTCILCLLNSVWRESRKHNKYFELTTTQISLVFI